MPNRTSDTREPAEHARARREGDTQTGQGPVQQPVPRKQPVPPMPYERDESADRQASDEPSARRMGQLAHDDVERGLVDTDKGPPLDATYEKYREGKSGGTKKLTP